ncbi:uncharacterized protein LOC131939239 [Physella acuta]|uniref:uncharacterized protein LOC131939239 n=1 Tax=Physella acuta TaxID=109671 RepID=UPI0027DDE1B6|nr:uncharacterized protein LOC131939239 [Physella acuta]
MTTLSSLGLQIFLLSNLTNATLSPFDSERLNTAIMRLSGNCTSTFVRLDQYDRVELTSNIWTMMDSVIQANSTCTAHFMTGDPDQGICVHANDLFFKRPTPGIQIKIFTSKVGPDKQFNYHHSKFRHWCTTKPLISVELTTARDFHDQNGEYRYSFLISNVSKEHIITNYHLDTYTQCDLAQLIKSGKEIRITGQRYPTPDHLPLNCKLTLSTDSKEEYEELCVQVDDYDVTHNCMSKLVVEGFNQKFWPAVDVLGCNDSHSALKTGREMCSSAKQLTLLMSRTSPSDTGMRFSAVVKVKRHPYWEVVSQENYELRGLSFVKGLTFFIAAINSLAGIGAAVLASMFRNPRSFWKDWAESMNTANHCVPVHYEGNCPEVSCSQVEESIPSKSY